METHSLQQHFLVGDRELASSCLRQLLPELLQPLLIRLDRLFPAVFFTVLVVAVLVFSVSSVRVWSWVFR